MAEYRITIGGKSNRPGIPTRPLSKLELLKTVLIGLLALAVAVGVLITVIVIGSVIAGVLLIAVALAVILGLCRMLARLARK